MYPPNDNQHGYIYLQFKSIIDQEILQDAWNSFTRNRHYYTLEVKIIIKIIILLIYEFISG